MIVLIAKPFFHSMLYSESRLEAIAQICDAHLAEGLLPDSPNFTDESVLRKLKEVRKGFILLVIHILLIVIYITVVGPVTRGSSLFL